MLGINLQAALYATQKDEKSEFTRLPVGFGLITKTARSCTIGVQFLATDDFRLTDDKSPAIYKKRWSVEEYHNSLKQNVSISKSPTHTVKTPSNHMFCAVCACVKLEKLKCPTKLGHFEIKS